MISWVGFMKQIYENIFDRKLDSREGKMPLITAF